MVGYAVCLWLACLLLTPCSLVVPPAVLPQRDMCSECYAIVGYLSVPGLKPKFSMLSVPRESGSNKLMPAANLLRFT